LSACMNRTCLKGQYKGYVARRLCIVNVVKGKVKFSLSVLFKDAVSC
jgi:hypothetical protein